MIGGEHFDTSFFPFRALYPEFLYCHSCSVVWPRPLLDFFPSFLLIWGAPRVITRILRHLLLFFLTCLFYCFFSSLGSSWFWLCVFEVFRCLLSNGIAFPQLNFRLLFRFSSVIFFYIFLSCHLCYFFVSNPPRAVPRAPDGKFPSLLTRLFQLVNLFSYYISLRASSSLPCCLGVNYLLVRLFFWSPFPWTSADLGRIDGAISLLRNIITLHLPSSPIDSFRGMAWKW